MVKTSSGILEQMKASVASPQKENQQECQLIKWMPAFYSSLPAVSMGLSYLVLSHKQKCP